LVTYAAKSSSATGVLTPWLTRLQKLVLPLKNCDTF